MPGVAKGLRAGLGVGIAAGAVTATVGSAAALADALTAHDGVPWLVMAGCGAALSVGTAVGLWQLTGGRAPIEGRTGDLLEAVTLLADGQTLAAKDGSLMQVVELSGLDYGNLRAGDLAAVELMRKQTWMDLASLGATFKCLSRRERVSVLTAGEFGSPVLEEIGERWASRFARAFRNRHFVTVRVDPGAHGERRLGEAVRALREGTTQYQSVILEGRDLLAWVGHTLNGRPVVVGDGAGAPGMSLGDRVGVVGVGFDKRSGVVSFREDGREWFCMGVGLREWGLDDSEAFFEGMLSLPLQMEVLISLRGLPRDTLPARLELDRRQQGLFFRTSAAAQDFSEAIERVASDEDTFLHSQVVVFIYGSKEEVEWGLSTLRTWAKNFGHEVATELKAAEYLWRSRLPGTDQMVRPRRLSASNLGKLLRWENQPVGLDRCDWGDGPIRVYPTASGAPYSLQFHVSAEDRAVGHGIIIGDTGSGKTALTLHNVGGAVRHHDLRMYLFDSGQGCRPWCEAVADGGYVHVGGGDCDLNPLAWLDDDADFAFCNRWLRMLAGVDGPEAYEDAARALEAIAKLPPELRSLRQGWQSAFPKGSELKAGLKRWAAATGVGKLFNGRDSLDVRARVTGFALDDLDEEPDAAAAALDYITHRVMRTARTTARPFLAFIDEAPRLLGNPVFKQGVKTWLFEARKARGAVLLAFQTVKSILDTGIADAILGQCPTRFLLPNPSAKWDDYQLLGLSEAQFELIKGTHPATRHLGKRWCMLKRPNECVILDTNLACLGNYLGLYRGGPDESRRVMAAQAEHGENWVWQYLDV